MKTEHSSRLSNCFANLAERGEKGFIAYITAGDPDIAATLERVLRLAEAGVDVIELGVPFSDPLADGPVNQEASLRALQSGTTLVRVFEVVREIRRQSDIPVVFFSYLNPWVARGFERAAAEAARAGADGLLPLDLAIEEAPPYLKILKDEGLDRILLVSPTSTDERIGRITAATSGFIYCVSRMGVTGARQSMQRGAGPLVRRIKKHSKLPVALGFGVSSPEQARQAAGQADAVVVGSAIVRRLHEAGSSRKARQEAYQWIASLTKATHESGQKRGQ